MSNVASRLRALIPLTTYQMDQTWDDMGMDSLDRIELLMAIEEEFGVEISDEQAAKLNTPDHTVQYLLVATGAHA